MKLFSEHIEDLNTLYLSNLKRALDLEQKIVASLPDLIAASTDPDLAAAFRKHLEESRGHARNVASLLEQHTGSADTETCKVMNGLAAEAADTIKDVTNPTVRDIALITAGQQVEHHEIAVYGGLRRWAALLGFAQDAAILKAIQEEEKAADLALTVISDSVNREGVAA